MTRALILGGSRSAKSAHAESLASGSGKEVVYIASVSGVSSLSALDEASPRLTVTCSTNADI